MAGAFMPQPLTAREGMTTGIEWFRDLSIAILGFVTLVVLILGAVLIYRLYSATKSTLSAAQTASKNVSDTVTMIREGSIQPMTTMLTSVQGVRQGFECICGILNEESTEGQKMDKKTLVSFGIGLVAGAVIGGAVALLYAPKSGKETRELLKSKAEETRDGALDFADQVRVFAAEYAAKVKAAGDALKT